MVVVGASTMRTSIDFQQLLREERRRAIESRKKKASPNGGKNSAFVYGGRRSCRRVNVL